jgi:hypothetical protein
MARKRRKRIICPNCEQQLNDTMNYCFNCGQENHIKRVSVKMLLSDFSTTYFSFDSKLFSSLKYLLIKPSFLSLEYLNGKIEAYLRPIRMYVFISFVFFLLNSMLSTNSTYDSIKFTKDGEPVGSELVQEELKTTDTDDIEEDSFLEIDNSLFDGKLKKIFSDEKEIKLFIVFLKSKLPILFFLLIPVLGLLFFIFFYKKKYFYVDHLVFALHLQSFMFVLLIINLLTESVFKVDLIGIGSLLFLIYGFIAARRFYNLGKLNTFFRLSIVGLFHLFLSLIIFAVFFLILIKNYNL